MLVFNFGMQKSASTFGHQLVCAVLAQNGHDQTRRRHPALEAKAQFNFASSLDLAALRDLERQVGADCILAIKTHLPPPDWLADWISEGGARAFASFRDPRDMALSLLDAGVRSREKGYTVFSSLVTLDDVHEYLPDQIASFQKWRAIPGVMALGYDAVAFDTLATLRRIAGHLGVPLRAWSIYLKYAAGGRIGQFNKGVQARHKSELTAAQAARFERDYADFLRFCADHGEGLGKTTSMGHWTGLTRRLCLTLRLQASSSRSLAKLLRVPRSH